MSSKSLSFLELKNITRTFQTGEGEISVLKNLSFSIETGEVVAVIGPSGSGKTTLLNCIAGIDVPTSGAILIQSDTSQIDITQLSDDERATMRATNIAFVFQDFLLLDHLTVEQNVLLPLELHGITPRYTVDEILGKVGLLPKIHSPIGVLSRGERQRVAIARAFIGEIPFLIADEPTGNLDTTNSQKIMDMLLGIASEHGVTVLLVTHDPEIYKRASRVIDISKLPKMSKNQALLRALRINFASLWQVIFLLIGTFLAWGIAEYATSYFRERIESEIKTVISSDIEVSGRKFPTEENRVKMREIAQKYDATMSESIEFPFVVEQSGTGSRFTQVEVSIVDNSYPLYGKIDYSGNFSGALVNSEVIKFLSGGSIQIGENTIQVTGELLGFPEMGANPFSQNRSIFIRNSMLPFEAVASSGSLYRYDYEAGFAVPKNENKQALLNDLRGLFGIKNTPGMEGGTSENQPTQFRVREQRADGGNFTEIANTVNDFLGAILFASMLIVFSSFLVAFLHFVQERKDIGRILYRMGISENTLLRVLLVRLLAVTLSIATFFFGVGLVIPGLSQVQFYQFGVLTCLLILAMFWMILETLLSEYGFFQNNKKSVRWSLVGLTVILVLLYGYLAGGSLYPLIYAGIALILMERFIWLVFRYLPKGIEKFGFTGKVRFSLLDVLRSFTTSPVLGKISFSIFFLLSGTLTGVFLFSLSFRETLVDITRSPIDAYVVNISPKDYETLVKWNNPNQFYSTIRARIEKINNVSLAEHIGMSDVPREFSREFNITDSSPNTDVKLTSGRNAITKQEVTVDFDFAKRIGIGLGDSVTFMLAGRSFSFEIVGIRESKRSGITPFFFFQIPPGAIEGAPKTYFLTADIEGQTLDEWKSRIIKDSGNHVIFIDVRPILDQVIQYSQMVLAGVLGLFFYIASIGLLAFLMSERTFFALKIRKVQLYRLLGATKSDGYRILFYESILGNILPLFIGMLVGMAGFIVFIQSNPLLRLSLASTLLSLFVIISFFVISYFLTRKFISGKIEKTQPQIGNTNR